VRVRACARLSEHLVSVPAVTLSARKGGWDERKFMEHDVCSLFYKEHTSCSIFYRHECLKRAEGCGGSRAKPSK
jgi:hypothetical protein